MKILAVETSTQNFSLALAMDKKIVQRNLKLNGVLSDAIIPAIQGILKQSKITLKDLDGFAVGLGPGSFTSLRVGLSTVKGLAFALGKPVVGIPSLDVLAVNAEGSSIEQVCTFADARRNLVYSCLYHKTNGSFTKTSDYFLLGVDELLAKIKKDTVFVGDAIPLFKEKLKSSGRRRFFFANERDWYPQAKNLAVLATPRFEKKEFDNIDTLVPLYLYPEDCQVSR